jgi:hypothetical protein
MRNAFLTHGQVFPRDAVAVAIKRHGGLNFWKLVIALHHDLRFSLQNFISEFTSSITSGEGASA